MDLGLKLETKQTLGKILNNLKEWSGNESTFTFEGTFLFKKNPSVENAKELFLFLPLLKVHSSPKDDI